jgi:flavin-dependent dehydrogenase
VIHYDVAIIGAGVAGACAAIELSRAGATVVLLEKEKAPHHKVCGEFISGECLPVLEQLGVDFEALGATHIHQVVLRAGCASLQADLPFGARGLSRLSLDHQLMTNAEDAGAHVARGVLVKQVLPKSCAPASLTSSFVIETSQQPYTARQIFLATGKHDLKPLHVRKGREANAVGFKRHAKLPAALLAELEGRVELFLFRSGYAGLSLVEGGLANLCFILDRRTVRAVGSSWEQLTSYLAHQNTRLQRLLSAAQWQWRRPLATANIPYGFIYQQALPDTFVLGDQFSVIPSLTGDGIAQAVFTAQQAVARYRDIGSGLDRRIAIQQYNQQVGQAFRKQVRWGYEVQRLLRYHILTAWGLRLLQPFPKANVIERLIRHTRVPWLQENKDAHPTGRRQN